MFTKADGPLNEQSFLLFAALIAAAFALLHYKDQWKSAVNTNHELCATISKLHLGCLEHCFFFYFILVQQELVKAFGTSSVINHNCLKTV